MFIIAAKIEIYNDYSTLLIKNTVGDLDFFNVKTENAMFSKISAEGYGFSSDGSIVSADGVSQMFFTAQPVNNLFAVVYSRNHLAVLSANALTESGGNYTYDFWLKNNGTDCQVPE